MKNFLAVLLFVSSINSFGQDNFIKWNETSQLTWDDFSGKINDTSKYDAECFAEIRYQYRLYDFGKWEFDVNAHFDKNISWSRKEKQSEALLRHEQLHFNIAQLFAEKLQKDFNTSSFTESYNDQIQLLFKQAKQEYQAMQIRYDEETNHSLNKEKQKEWEGLVDYELAKTRLSLQLVQIELAQNSKRDIERGR
jgi:hypothetical protein